MYNEFDEKSLELRWSLVKQTLMLQNIQSFFFGKIKILSIGLVLNFEYGI